MEPLADPYSGTTEAGSIAARVEGISINAKLTSNPSHGTALRATSTELVEKVGSPKSYFPLKPITTFRHPLGILGVLLSLWLVLTSCLGDERTTSLPRS